jgi:DNA/RNA-binding protein KIN17
MKKDRMNMSDEQRERLMIAEQIEKAKAEAGEEGPSSNSPPVEEGLKRDEGEQKVVLSFALKATPSAEASSSAPSLGLKNPLKMNANPLKANPLKRPNPLKSPAGAPEPNDKKRPASAMSAAERLIVEDQERKRRKMERESN